MGAYYAPKLEELELERGILLESLAAVKVAPPPVDPTAPFRRPLAFENG